MPRDRAVGHAHAGVAGVDVDVLLAAGVAAACRRGSRSAPCTARTSGTRSPGTSGTARASTARSSRSAVRVVGVAGLVVLAAGDQHVVVADALEADVVVRVFGVPVEPERAPTPSGCGSRGRTSATGTAWCGSSTRSFTGVFVVTTTAPAVTAAPAGRLDPACRFAAFDLAGVRVAVDPPAALPDRLGQAGEVLQRVELRPAAGSRGTGRCRTTIGARSTQCASVQPDAMGGVEFLLQEVVPLPVGRDEQVAVHAVEVAVDLLGAGDLWIRSTAAEWLSVASRRPSVPWSCSIFVRPSSL